MIGGTDTVTRCPAPLDRPGPAAVLRHTSYLELAPLPSAAPCARLHAVHVLHEWGLRALADDAALIVSEIVTNAADASAILPDRPPIALRLLATEKLLRIEVWDQSPHDIEPRKADADAECGRGLTVVAALSTRWCSKRTSYQRKVVWAELDL
jgi:anti-sigma regulatory factor (Ser/Thr protein kinase)